MAHRSAVRSCVVVGLSALALAASAPAVSAAPVPCSTSLTDSTGTPWAQFVGQAVVVPVLGVGVTGIANGGLPTTLNTTPATCESQLGGRELSGPPQVAGPGVTVARRLYVPSGAPAFARLLDKWTNTTGSPVTVDPYLATTSVAGVWRQTSSGDAVVTTADDWVVLANTTAPTDPTLSTVGEIWSGPGARRPAAFEVFGPGFPAWTSGIAALYVRWGEITIAPGESRYFMHAYLLRGSGAGGLSSALADTAAVAVDSRLYDGISQEEQLKLVNFAPLDGDEDGVAEAVDNCKLVPNPTQTDTDGDGQGDACDLDDDNDGLSDALEAQLGSNPLGTDTDGDGKLDGFDSCLKLAAATLDGCPEAQSAATTPQQQAPAAERPSDKTAPACGISGVKKTLKPKAFLKGVAATITCDEPATVDGELVGSARSVRLAAAFNLTLGTRSLGLGGGPRKLTIKPAKRLVGKAKKLTVQLRVTATDASGNRTRKTQTIKVK